jgi:hypothetical protein
MLKNNLSDFIALDTYKTTLAKYINKFTLNYMNNTQSITFVYFNN